MTKAGNPASYFLVSALEQLQSKVAVLPEILAVEVLDFLEYLAAKRASERELKTNAVGRFRGTFKGKLSSSDEFSRKKSDELRLER